MTASPASAAEIAVNVAVPSAGISQILYAAAFIDPAVRHVALRDGAWVFSLAQPVSKQRLTTGLTRLVERFQQARDDTSDAIFELVPKTTLPVLAPPPASQEIHPGLFVYGQPVSTLLRFLDHAMLVRFATPFGAIEEVYPNCIPAESLSAAHHLGSFPEHLHFLTHLREDLDLLDDFSQRAKAGSDTVVPNLDEVSRLRLVQNPSTCYHCYAARRDGSVDEDVAITATTRCHRYEAANHHQFGRLLEFTMREVIFLGTPDYARATRAQCLQLIEQLAMDWQLYGELSPANDPFFSADFAAKANQQRRLAMKFEYRMTIPGQEKKLAVMSSNLHGPTFSKAFNIKRRGRVINSGCLGFGIERLALAIIAQHGSDPALWPPGLAQDFAEWRTNDPLAR